MINDKTSSKKSSSLFQPRIALSQIPEISNLIEEQNSILIELSKNKEFQEDKILLKLSRSKDYILKLLLNFDLKDGAIQALIINEILGEMYTQKLNNINLYDSNIKFKTLQGTKISEIIENEINDLINKFTKENIFPFDLVSISMFFSYLLKYVLKNENQKKDKKIDLIDKIIEKKNNIRF